MDERDDYADRDLPPPRKMPPLEIVFGLLGVALLVAMLAAACYLSMFPKVRD